MSKKKKYSQGHLIDEVRSVREKLWKEYRGDTRKMAAHAKKIAKKYGIKTVKPKIEAKSLKELRALKTRKDPAA